MKTIPQLLAAAALLAVAGSAQADAIVNAATGLAAPTAVETFDAPADEFSSAGDLFAGVSFNSNAFVTSAYGALVPTMSGQQIVNFVDGCVQCDAPTMLTFSAPVWAAAFNFATNPGTSTFSAWLGQTQVDSFSADSGLGGGFYGFSGVQFDRIFITAGGDNQAFVLDNLQTSSVPVSAVPEADGYALLLAGLGVTGLFARARKAGGAARSR